MAILTFPSNIPKQVRWSLVSNTTIHTSPLSRYVQTVEKPGALWRADITMPPMNEATARPLIAFYARLRGASGRFRMPDHSLPNPVGTPGGTILAEVDYELSIDKSALDAASWTVSNASITANADGVSDKLVENTATTSHFVNQTVPNTMIPHGVTCHLRLEGKPSGRDWLLVSAINTDNSFYSGHVDLSTGTLGTVQGAVNSAVTSVGSGYYRYTFDFPSGEGANALQIRIHLSTGDLVNTYLGDGASGLLLRNAWIGGLGVSQTGNQIGVSGATVSQASLFGAGDYVTVNDELKMITDRVDSNADGGALLGIEPPIRVAVADATTIDYTAPTCLMRLLDDNQMQFGVSAPFIYGGHTISCIEAPV